MRWDLNNKYAIATSSLEVTVIRKEVVKSGKNEGEILETPAAHCSTLDYACKWLIDQSVRDSKTVNDFKGLVKEIRAMKKDIDTTFKALNFNFKDEFKKDTNSTSDIDADNNSEDGEE